MRAFIPLFASLLLPLQVTAGTITHETSSESSWLEVILQQKMPMYKHLGQCIEYAAYQHKIHAELILSVIMVENGAARRVNPNNNGSTDHGIMQINTVRMPEIEHYGVSIEDLVENDCMNVFVGTYILANEISKAGDFWEGVGNYHYNKKGKYPTHHFRYIQKVFNAWTKLIE